MSFTLTEITNQRLNTQLMAKDNTGSVTPLSAMKDENNETVLRVVDAAPFAYDPASDRLKTAMSPENLTKYESVFTGTIAADTSELFYVEFKGESEVWFIVSTDQPSWTLRSGNFFDREGVYDSTFFPKIGSTQSTTHTESSPMTALFIPLGVAGDGVLTAPSTLEDAKRYPLSPGGYDFRFQFRNRAETPANVKVSILRVYN